MGTRADFYVGRGTEAAWIGSYPYDGYPEGIDAAVLNATTEPEYREAVAIITAGAKGTTPDQGWPWPWDDSRTTDYAYTLDDGKVWCSNYGSAWFDPLTPLAEDEDGDAIEPSGDAAVFPDMTARKIVTLGERSGLIVFGA